MLSMPQPETPPSRWAATARKRSARTVPAPETARPCEAHSVKKASIRVCRASVVEAESGWSAVKIQRRAVSGRSGSSMAWGGGGGESMTERGPKFRERRTDRAALCRGGEVGYPGAQYVKE